MFDVIEKLKTEWTDRYVVVHSSAPELARFANATGTVKTVNMNGRCLVQFDQFNNTGWYDIDPTALRIVTEPRPKPVEKEAPKAAGTEKSSAASKPTAKPAAGRPSTADILAAARAKAGGATAAGTPAATPAAEKKAAAPGGRLSTSEILARARGGKTATPPAADAPAASADAAAEMAPGADEHPPAKPAVSAKKSAAAGPLPATTAEKIAWCRQHDAKG